MRIVLLSNRASGRYHRNHARLTRALAGLPEVAHHELAGPLDTDALARADLVAINGGDGTTQRVLTELMEGPMARALPPIAILAGGTTNMTANDIGLRGDPVRALKRLVAAARAGTLERRTHDRPILRVAGGVGIGPQRGLFFGAAGIVDAIRHCKAAVHSRGLKGEWASFATLVSLLARAATRGADAAGIGGQHVTARLADGPASRRPAAPGPRLDPGPPDPALAPVLGQPARALAADRHRPPPAGPVPPDLAGALWAAGARPAGRRLPQLLDHLGRAALYRRLHARRRAVRGRRRPAPPAQCRRDHPLRAAVTRLETLVAAEARRPAMAAAHVLAEAARAQHGASVAAVLFYGSCLREAADEGRILDLYLLVDSYRAAGEGPVLAFLARLLPPNVHYLEIPFDGRRIRAKYALLSTAELADRVTDRGESYFWGRFAQPVRVLWARDQTTEARLIEALAQATRTFLDETIGLLPKAPAADLWPMGLGLSYRTELRPEKPHKSAELYRASAAHYEAVLDAYRAEERPLADHGTLRRRWRRRRLTRQMALGPAPVQGRLHLRWRVRLSPVEDRAAFRRAAPGDPLAAAPPDPRRTRPVRPPLPRGRLSLVIGGNQVVPALGS